MRAKGANPDAEAAKLAVRQHGVVSHSQLRWAGISSNGISRRVAAGRLHRIHRGVYALGHTALAPEGRWMAAVLACGEPIEQRRATSILDRWGAAVSHGSAAALWGLIPRCNGPVHVSVPGSGGRRMRRGVRVHRTSSLTADEVTLHRGIPVTAPARTLRDLRRAALAGPAAGGVSAAALRRAIRTAEVLGLAVDPVGEPRDRTRSELERRFLRLCRTEGLPAPEVNVRVGGVEVDFLWRERRLVVETDGYRYHRGRQAFEDDRSRDLKLRALGFEVIRLSHRQLLEEPGAIVAVLRLPRT